MEFAISIYSVVAWLESVISALMMSLLHQVRKQPRETIDIPFKGHSSCKDKVFL